MRVSFPDLPNDARVWLFALNRDLSSDEKNALLDALEPFLASWTSHNRPVPATADVRADRVFLVAAHIDAEALNAGVSGCGIDKMEAAVEQALSDLNLERIGPLSVVYRTRDGWEEASRAEFKARASSGAISPETPVLDVTPQTLAEVREAGIERPVRTSWLGKTFELAKA